MQTVSVHAAKTHFSRLVGPSWGRRGDHHCQGWQTGKPVAKLVPLSRTVVGRSAVWQAWPSFLRISIYRFPDL
jgi:antitoxin (DNA-binding transcriptional repressor) of toxin-antitoxin stability system